jgi:hypothetical protein
MDERDFLEKISEHYRKEGYVVISHPGKDHLPDHLGDLGIDLLARRGDQAVVVQIKSRDKLYDLNGLDELAGRVKLEPGWRLDVVVFPPEGGVEVPPDGVRLGVGEIQSLADEASRALAAGLIRASFVIAWSAVEAAMREAAQREGIQMDRETPSFILKSIYSNGTISREDYGSVGKCFHVRNALVHGFAPPAFEAADVEFLVSFARRILSPEPVHADT